MSRKSLPLVPSEAVGIHLQQWIRAGSTPIQVVLRARIILAAAQGAQDTQIAAELNRMVDESDFVQAGQAVNLSVAGRRRFFQAYEQRMCSLITHPLFDYKVSYRRALELQARLLAKALTGEIADYIPLLTR